MIDVARIFGAPVTDAGGKSAPNTVGERHAAPKIGADGGRQLPHRGVSLRVAERVDVHRSDLRDPSQIVPHHVDDHDVLRALLLGVHEPMRAPRRPPRDAGRASAVPFIGRE